MGPYPVTNEKLCESHIQKKRRYGHSTEAFVSLIYAMETLDQTPETQLRKPLSDVFTPDYRRKLRF